MSFMDFLAQVLNPNPGQNRLVGGQGGSTNYLAQTGLGQQMPSAPQGAPVEAFPQAPAPQMPFAQQAPMAAPQAPQGGGIGGLLGGLFGGGGGVDPQKLNNTIQWLQDKGMDPQTAQAVAGNKDLLQTYLRQQMQPQTDGGFSLSPGEVRYDGKGNVIATGAPKPEDHVTNMSPEEAAAMGLPPGVYQKKADGTITTVGGKRDEDPTFQRENALRDQYSSRPEYKRFDMIQSAYGRIREAAQQGTGVGDLGVIFGYMKMLDPTSVVREGEQASAQNAAGVPEKVRNIYNNVMTGQKLDDPVRQQFLAASEKLYGQEASSVTKLNSQYEKVAKYYNIDPTNILVTPQVYEPITLGQPVPQSGGLPVAPPTTPQAAQPSPQPSAPERSYTDQKQIFGDIQAGKLKIGDVIILNGKRMKVDP